MTHRSFEQYQKVAPECIKLLRSVCEHLLYGGQGGNESLFRVVALYSKDIPEYLDTTNMLERIQEQMATQPKEYFTGLWLTYEEWKARGYQVQSGEKAYWKKGIPLFSENQTRPIQYNHRC